MPDPDEQLSAGYARAVLDAFGRGAANANVDAMLRVMAEDALLIGSSADEKAFGRDAVRKFLEGVFASVGPVTWEWDRVETRAEDGVAWFFAEGRVVFGGELAPYRASGVCRRDLFGEWQLAMFHGSTPDPS